MDQFTDEDLMLQFQNGSRDACGILFERYKRILLAYFYNNTSSRTLSQDLLQITFEKLIKYHKRFKRIERFKPWIFTIARNALIDVYNKKNKRKENSLDQFDDQRISIKNHINLSNSIDSTALLAQAIQKISAEKRELISMVKLNGMRYKEAAYILETTEANIKVKVFRIMQELKTIIHQINEV